MKEDNGTKASHLIQKTKEGVKLEPKKLLAPKMNKLFLSASKSTFRVRLSMSKLFLKFKETKCKWLPNQIFKLSKALQITIRQLTDNTSVD